MKRILVIGTSGSGKTTLAQTLAQRLGLPFTPTDPLYWQPGWQPRPARLVRRQVRKLVTAERWVLDGNFDDQRSEAWRRAECIVWLDYPLSTVLGQVARRNLGWFINGTETWAGNRMSLVQAISGILHALKSHRRKSRSYPIWLAQFPKLQVIRLKNSQECQEWLRTFDNHAP